LDQQFGTDVQETVNAVLNWPVLMLGLGGIQYDPRTAISNPWLVFWWVPCVGYLGARPTAILAALITFVTSIWSAVATSFHSLEAARIICCWATSCGEVLPAIVVRDVFFLHERGGSMGLYMVFFQALPSLGNVLAGFCIQGAGWRWWLWVTSSSSFPS